MAEPASTGMDRAEMRKLLTGTKEKPVHCAIGIGKDPGIGLLLMDKMKAPKILEKQLMLAIPDTKNTRWGTAAVDWEDDPKLVKLYLNKPISGMARKLVKTLKGTGFSKVQIMLEDGTSVETAADEEADAEAAAAGAAGPTAAPPPPPPPPEATAPGPDAAELSKRLAALIPRVAQVADPVRKAEMAKLASLSNVNIKTNNLVYAATYIQQLATGLDAAPPAPPPSPPQAAAPAQDAGAMARQLAALIPRVAQVADPAQKATLSKLATDVNVNIKTNNLTYAATYLAQLQAGLDRAATPAAPAAAAAPADLDGLRKLWSRLTLTIPKAAKDNEAQAGQWTALSEQAGKLLDGGDAAAAAPAVEALRAAMASAVAKLQEAAKAAGTYDKSGQAWMAARKSVEDGLGRLRSSILTAYKGEPFAGEIEAKFDERTKPVLASFDLRLADTLGEVAKATDQAKRAQLIGQAHDLIDGYRAFAADPLIGDLDANPFVPLTMQATVGKVLDVVDRELH